MEDRKKALKKAWQTREREKLLESIPLPHSDLRDLFAFVGRNAPPCDHTLRVTTHFLQGRNLDVQQVVTWLREHGGYCDCEVVFNVEATFGDLIGGD